MGAQHQIVIIGASFAGIPTAHGLLKDILPKLSNKTSYKVVLVSASDHFYFKVGAPRTVINPDKIPADKILLPVADGFKAYPKEKFEFVHAAVTAVDPATQTLALDSGNTLHYDSLVVASGTYFSSNLWSVANGLDNLRTALKDIHERLPSASSVLVVGGGPVGVETSGELGETYGGKKEITILSGTSRLLARYKNVGVGRDAESRLANMGVKTVNDVKVVSKISEGDKTRVELSDGTTMTVDLYIDATGDRPNSKYLPAEWLNERGFAKTNPETLRLEVPETKNIYVFGSVGSYSDGSIIDMKFAIKPLLESIRLDLVGQGEPSLKAPPFANANNASWLSWLMSWIPFFGTAEPAKRKVVYKKIQSDMGFVPVGSQGGVGVVMGYKIPSFVVKMFKAKDFMVSHALQTVNGTG